jgi:hypothetical protein
MANYMAVKVMFDVDNAIYGFNVAINEVSKQVDHTEICINEVWHLVTKIEMVKNELWFDVPLV